MPQPESSISLTLKNHRKQSLWQIWLPMLAAALLFIAAMVWLISALIGQGPDGLRGTADAAVVWIVMPWLLWSFLGLALLIGLAVLVVVLRKKVPGAGAEVLAFFHKARQLMRTGSDATAKPVIAIQEWAAKANQAADSLRQRFSKG